VTKVFPVPLPERRKTVFCLDILGMSMENTEFFIVQSIFRNQVGKFTPLTISKTISMANEYGFEILPFFIS
jgi:hypothetical protein